MTSSEPHIVYAERLGGGVIITFDDGRCAVYSALLLHNTFPQATEVKDSDTEEDLVE